MAACPVDVTPLAPSRRRPLALTQIRLEANRRNAARSTGPRTAQGKARVARNAIKHGFFVAQERWTPAQYRDFATTLNGLRENIQPDGMLEEGCVQTIAASFVKMASLLRYENIAALKHHQNLDRAMSQRIAAAPSAEATRLRTRRNRMRRAGLWRPTLPAEREARAIIRYEGRINRAIRDAASQLAILKNLRTGGGSSTTKSQKQTHCSASLNNRPEARLRAFAQRFEKENAKPNRREVSPNGVLRAGEGPQEATSLEAKNAKTNPQRKTSNTNFETIENAKTNPLSSMFTGNRHERRRAKALARRR